MAGFVDALQLIDEELTAGRASKEEAARMANNAEAMYHRGEFDDQPTPEAQEEYRSRNPQGILATAGNVIKTIPDIEPGKIASEIGLRSKVGLENLKGQFWGAAAGANKVLGFDDTAAMADEYSQQSAKRADAMRG